MAIGTTAALVGATVGAGLLGSKMQSDAAKQAAKTQAQAAADAGQQEWAMYQQTREDQMPWLETGKQGLTRLSDLMGLSGNTGAEGYGSLNKTFTGDDLYNDPGYQFRMSEGLKALDRSASAKGNVFSGAAGKALTRYGQGMGAQEFDAARNRYREDQADLFNRLSGLSGTGQTTANNLGTSGANVAQSMSDLNTGAAAANAAGIVGSANAWNSGLQNTTNTLASLYKPQPKIYWNN